MKRAGRCRIFLAALAVGGVLSYGYVIDAQTPAPKPAQAGSTAADAPRYLNVNIVHVKPELLTEWRDFQIKEAIPTLKKGGVTEREAWQTAIGEAFEYAFVTPVENLAVRDGPSPIAKALGEEGARAYGARTRRFVSRVRSYVIRTRPDLSYAPGLSGSPKLAVLSEVSVAPGRILDYENHVKTEVLPIQSKAQVRGYMVAQTVFGGDGMRFLTLNHVESFADLDKGPAALRLLGAEGAAKLAAKTAGIVMHVERTVIRHDPELSFTAAGSSAAK